MDRRALLAMTNIFMDRMDRINNQVKREIGVIIQQEFADPRLQFVSITKADVSKDLRNGRIYFSVLGDEKQRDEVFVVLKKIRGAIRHYLGKKLNLRNVPELFFQHDKTIEENIRLTETLDDILDDEKYSEDHS